MNLDELKGKTVDDKLLADIKAHVEDLTGQRDAARAESINGRKTLKVKAEAAEANLAKALEKLGLDSADEIDGLPDAKGQADAAKQLEAKLKTAQRQIESLTAERDQIQAQARDAQLSADLSAAVGKHSFVDNEIVGNYLRSRVEWVDGKPMFKDDKGGMVPLEEGAAYIAKTKPHLVKSSGAAGSGHTPAGGAGAQKNPWSKATFNLTEQGRLMRDNPQQAAAMQAEAAAAGQ